MNKEILNKIRSCKALQGKTIADICEMPEFRDNLGAYIGAQREDRKAIRASYEAMKKLGGAKGYKLPAHPIDKVIGLSNGFTSSNWGNRRTTLRLRRWYARSSPN